MGEAEVVAMETAEKSESSSESDSEGVQASDEDYAALAFLEEQLQANQNLYDKHVEYIALLRRCKLKIKLRAARKAMHSRFPLSEPLWLEWLDDEESDLESAADVKELQKLFDLAVSDYLSIPIWLKYLAVMADYNLEVKAGSTAGKEQMREVYERALSAGGLHVSEGGKIWAAARKYETDHIDSEDPTTPEESVVARLFMRQLQVPLQDGPQTLQEWRELCKKPETLASEDPQKSLPESIKAGYAAAQAAVRARASYEASVAPNKPADLDLLAAYTAYIKLEEASKEVGRVQCIYERAVAKFPVTHALWMQYSYYLEQHLNVAQVVRQVYARAVRNCPWVGALWARSLRAAERLGVPDNVHEDLYNDALGAGMEAPDDYMEVSLARLDCIRRQGKEGVDKLRAAFQSVTELMQTYFPDYLDRSLRIPSYWATCELELADNHEAGKEVWEAALRTDLGMYAEAVAAYVAFELSAKHVKGARSIFKKFHRRKMHEGGNVALCEAWLRFEREHSSAEDYFQALIKVEPVISAATAAFAEAARPDLAEETRAASKRAPQLSKEEMIRMRQEKDPSFKKPGRQTREQQKRRRGVGFEGEGGGKRAKADAQEAAEPSASAAAPEFQSSGTKDVNMVDAPNSGPEVMPSATDAAVRSPEGEQVPKAAAGSSQMLPPPSRTVGAAQGNEAQSGSIQQQQQQIGELQRTAYIRNIAPTATRAELQQLLNPCGQIMELNLPEDRNSQPPKHRGFAYVTFSSPDGLRNAVALDGTELQGKALSVVASHRQVHGDERTAFVLNLAPNTTSESLEALFGACGPIESTRIPLDRNTSQPRGFAYIEFGSSEALQSAMDMTGIELDGRNLKVSVASQPGQGGGGRRPPLGGRGRGPGRAQPWGRGGRGGPMHGFERSGGLENGGSGYDFGSEGRGRPRAGRTAIDVGGRGETAFRPRSVGRGGATQRSNADFRELLNK